MTIKYTTNRECADDATFILDILHNGDVKCHEKGSMTINGYYSVEQTEKPLCKSEILIEQFSIDMSFFGDPPFNKVPDQFIDVFMSVANTNQSLMIDTPKMGFPIKELIKAIWDMADASGKRDDLVSVRVNSISITDYSWLL